MAENKDPSDDKQLPPDAQRDLFWKRLGAINAGMLGLTADLKLVPMSHTADRDGHALWFITAHGVHLVEATTGSGGADALYIVADGSEQLYARIKGRLEVVEDEARLDALWNPVAASWFEEGRDDPDIRLLKLSISQAEVWATTGSLGFLYGLARNKLTGKQPDMGEQFSI